jgi:hypothetical protein
VLVLLHLRVPQHTPSLLLLYCRLLIEASNICSFHTAAIPMSTKTC